ncbi:3-phosphoshikimate 1-carboxyvinyltransferase, partial [Vibrio sp. 10N.222.49.C9]
EQLGVKYSLSQDKTVCEVEGLGGVFNAPEALELFLGNAGTAMRPLAAALCASQGEFVLTGEPRMKERPIGHLVDALREAGAEVTYLENDGFPALKIQGTGLTSGEVSIDGSISGQFLTAFLMTAPLADGDITINIEGDLV